MSKTELEINIEKFDLVNSERSEYAIELSNASMAHIIKVLPLFFHINHPRFIFYVQDCPSRIARLDFTLYHFNFLRLFNVELLKDHYSEISALFERKAQEKLEAEQEKHSCSRFDDVDFISMFKNNWSSVSVSNLKRYNSFDFLDWLDSLDASKPKDINLSKIKSKSLFTYIKAFNAMKKLAHKDDYKTVLEKYSYSNQESCFVGIYTIGSTASINQGLDSDLDVWLILKKDITEQEIKLIKTKADMISSSLQSNALDVNIYLVVEDSFFNQSNNLSNLNNIVKFNDFDCYDTGNVILLDEFYRSCVCIAGKRMLWHCLPVEPGLAYNAVKANYIANGIIKEDDWIDFGDVTVTPTTLSELYGAMMWQLSKQITSPFKSSLKILATEIYISSFPNIEFLCNKIRDDENYINQYDQYLNLLEYIMLYVKNEQRTSFILMSFYIKMNYGIKVGFDKPWMLNKIKYLEDRYYDPNDSELLNKVINYKNWRINDIVNYNYLLRLNILEVYKNTMQKIILNTFYSFNPIKMANIFASLFKYYRDNDNNIPLYYKDSSHKTLEKCVLIREVLESTSEDVPGWYLDIYQNSDTNQGKKTIIYTEHHHNLIWLLAWGYFNNIIDDSTWFDVHSKNISSLYISHLVSALQNNFSLSNWKIDYSFDITYDKLTNILIIARPGEHAYTYPLSQSYVIERMSLEDSNTFVAQFISAIDIIIMSDWGGVKILSFDSENFYTEFLDFIKKHLTPQVEVRVECFITFFSFIIKRHLYSALDSVLERKSSCRSFPEPLPVVQNSIYEDMLVSKYKATPKSKNINPLFVSQDIVYCIQPDVLQVFIEELTDNSFNCFIIDQNNEVEYYTNAVGNLADFTRDIFSMYAHLSQRDNFFEDINLTELKIVNYQISNIDFSFTFFYKIEALELNKYKVSKFTDLDF